MNFKVIRVGFLKTNCYILSKDNKEIIIDPGADAKEILNNCNDVIGILITHKHPDHIGALKNILKKTNDPIIENLEGKKEIGPFKFEIIKTPGHTDDSVTYYFEEDNIMFTGDFLFKDTVGRTDLPTGNINVMNESIEKIKKYPDCKVMPGHGRETTLNYEKENNIYF